MRHGNAQLGDFLFLFLDEWIKLRNFAGVLALLLFAETEEISLILRPPAMEIEAVFFDDGLTKLFDLVEFGTSNESDSWMVPLFAGSFANLFSVNLQGIIALS